MLDDTEIAKTLIPKSKGYIVRSFPNNESPIFTIVRTAARLLRGGLILDLPTATADTLLEQFKLGFGKPRLLTRQQVNDLTEIGLYLINLRAGGRSWPKSVPMLTNEEMARIQWLISYMNPNI